jgi:asparagine synthase (glutamine-hydrolysing)
VCGICGTVGSADAAVLRWMTDVMAHRGPDGEGVRTFPGDLPAGLGHRRLTIIDPSPAGAQPMDVDGRFWITYNGELYNFRTLRDELERAGHRFKSRSDTEVVLRLFVEHGPAMLDRMNGIFAFGIWDTERRRLFLARDRLGVKPLYHTRQNGVFAFASELKALLPLVGRPTLDPTALLDYLTFLWVPDPRTAFAEIEMMPAGHYAWVDSEGLSLHRYWDLEFAPEERPEREWIDLVGTTVTEAVQRQMVADVPLGSFLSGGVDSSAVVAAMARTGRVSTYTIGFAADDLKHEIVPDDVRYARRVAELFDVDYHERTLTPDVLELIPKAIWHLEEPVADPAAISTYLICREAGQTMPVMLSGMGADEVFAGYPRHLAFQLSRHLDALPHALRARAEGAVRGLARPGAPGRLRGPRRNLWKYARAAGLEPLERYLSFCSYYTAAELAGLLAPDVAAELAGHDPLAVHRAHLARTGTDDLLSRLLYVDAKTFLPCLNLAYTDKMGMAASVEVRVPLLDDELVALAARIPSQLKLKGWRRKYVFKRSQEHVLPHQIVWRRKAGFGAPIRAWLERDLAPLVEDALSEEAIRARGLVDPRAVRRLWDENAAGRADNSLRLYALLCLELWCRTFVDRSWSFDEAPAAPVEVGA